MKELMVQIITYKYNLLPQQNVNDFLKGQGKLEIILSYFVVLLLKTSDKLSENRQQP